MRQIQCKAGAVDAGVKAMAPAAPLTVDDFTHLITQEVANALGLPRDGRHMRLLGPLVGRATGRLACLAVAFDADVASRGFRAAADRFAGPFIEGYDVSGVDKVPASGPLIIAANHPGVSDALVIAAALPREDSKLVISDVPLIRALPHGAEAFIPVSGHPDDHVRALRQMLRHLENGGTVILFPSTYLTPDPAQSWLEKDTTTAASFDNWSPSIALALRRVSGCRIQPAIVSGVIAPRFARHPLTYLVPAPRGWERQRMAEMLQVMAQIRRQDRLGLRPRLSFGEPISAADLDGARDREKAMVEVRARVGALLEAHQADTWAG
jgi:1-acyl-sn-glycerol-3-phosphate acyltransferase